MRRRCILDRSHPLTLLIWYISMITITVIILDPIITLSSLIMGTIHIILVNGKPTPSFALRCVLFASAAALLNPLFSHHGVTVLFFLRGLPITLEALLFGAEMSAAACAALMWCASLSIFMTSDKITMLFGSVMPRLAVLLSLTLRFIPLIREKHRNILIAQRGLRSDSEEKRSIKFYAAVYSALVSQILEDSIEMSDSMRSRGIRLKGRSFYSDFRLRSCDVVMISLSIVMMSMIVFLRANGAADFSFYPTVSPVRFTGGSCVLYLAFIVIGIMCYF